MAPLDDSRKGRALVITDPMVLVRHANEQLVMWREGKKVASVPISGLSHLALHGPVTMTGAAVARVLDAGLDVTLHTSGGRLRGQLTSMQAKNVFLLLAQVAAWQSPERKAAFARAVVASKLSGQRQFLQRHAIDHGYARCADAVRQIDALHARIAGEDGLDNLRGMEGAAAAAYFSAFREIVGDAWGFAKRVRRPPTDPVNALLSFGYTLATSEVARHLLRAGFDLRIGLFHGIRYGRESLPLDLVEDLRVPMVDRFTVALLRRRQLAADDFERQEDGAVRLAHDARRRYLELWEEMLERPAPSLRGEESEADGDAVTEDFVAAPPGRSEPDQPVTWRRRIRRQVRRLQQYLMRDIPYRGMLADGTARNLNDKGTDKKTHPPDATT